MKSWCSIVLATAALSAPVAGAKLRSSEDFSRGRRLVETSEGLWIENQYVAHVSGSENCDKVSSEITAWNQKTMGVFDNEEDFIVTPLAIESDCWIPFSGDSGLVDYLNSLPDIVTVDKDLVIKTVADPPSWGLNRIDQPSLPLSKGVEYKADYSGEGVNVYVIDTGVRADHNEFYGKNGRRAELIWSAFGDAAYATDGHGHGTHCSGTIGGLTVGVATAVNIKGVQVLNAAGSGSTTGVIAGVQFAISHQKANYKNEPAVLSMSLGGSSSTAMNNAVKAAQSAGHIVVVAAGNDGKDACLVSPAGAGGSGKTGGVISVGATMKTDQRSSFSNYGKCVDIFAPGSDIVSTWKDSETSMRVLSGTSMATPHVAGVAALLLEKHKKNRDAAQAELFAIAVQGKITDVKYDPSNLLLQIPVYSGPAKSPTPKPTMPPTMAPPSLCLGTLCVEFMGSNFGPQITTDTSVRAPLAVSSSKTLCSPTNEDFTGKIVLVLRGDCTFLEKVLNAQNQGALAVLIYNINDSTPIINPGTSEKDPGAEIPSLMISNADGKKFAAKVGSSVFLGSTSANPQTSFPTKAPTDRPTVRPTKAPTMRPTKYPTKAPTMRPTKRPTNAPTGRPTKAPTMRPTKRPTRAPTMRPTRA